MSDSKVRNWLQRAPHPNRVRTDSGEVILLQGRHKWQEAMSSIQAMEPATLEALDRDGNVIRTLQLDSNGREPRLVEDQLTALARIIAETADKAALRHESAFRLSLEANKEALAAVLKLTETVSNRLSHIERAYMQLVQKHAEAIQDAAEAGGGGDLDMLASSFIMAKLNGGQVPSSSNTPQQPKQGGAGGQPNGKGG